MLSARTITFGDVAENGPGMERIGEAAKSGLSYAELMSAKLAFERTGILCELVDLRHAAKLDASVFEEMTDDAKKPAHASLLSGTQSLRFLARLPVRWTPNS